jgi:rhodanese-related sulfurtransferase
MPGEISAKELAEQLQNQKPVYLVDVRDPWERHIAALPDHCHIPMGELPGRIGDIQPPEGAVVVLYCHHGIRSLAAAGFLEQKGFWSVKSLSGGIDAWAMDVDSRIPFY